MEEILKQILTKLDGLEAGQAYLQKGQDAIALEQVEMRKEVAFYYGSMMKKLDDTKHELSSEMKQFGKIQEEHQHVLQLINEKQ